MATKESSIQRSIRLALAKVPGAVFWRNQVGVAHYERGGRKYKVPYGLCKGSADLIGMVDGRFVALEVKTKMGRVSNEQRMFRHLVRSKGGFAAVVRSVEEALEAVEHARRGCSGAELDRPVLAREARR